LGCFIAASKLRTFGSERGEGLSIYAVKILTWLQQKYFGARDLTLIFRGLPITDMILSVILTVRNAVQKMQLAGGDSTEGFLM